MHAVNTITNVVIGRSSRVACQSQFLNSAGPMSWHAGGAVSVSGSGTGLYCRKVTLTKITRMLWSVRSVHKTHKTVIQHLLSDIDIQWKSRLKQKGNLQEYDSFKKQNRRELQFWGGRGSGGCVCVWCPAGCLSLQPALLTLWTCGERACTSS